MGSERITSKVGNLGIFSSSPVEITEQQAKYTLQTGKIKERFDSLGVQYKGIQQTGGLVSSNPSPGADLYYYHPDHLGSSSLITDNNGTLVQHIQYVPFGEVFVEERASASSWQTPYLFNAKELDDETGLYYYGARYYDPRTSVWLSVDPLADKKLWMSSYVYCSNNPTNRVDPDGRDDTFDRKGENRQHIDNGTDNILIRDGENLNNITSYDYSEGQTDNRNMLSNVGTYYANEVGIEQRIGVYDLKPTEPREAFAATDPNSRQVLMAVFNGKFHQDAGNANNLKNGFVHEGVHKKDGKGGPEAELKAIHA
jgi:RHS repeat-associated protein